MPFPLIIIGGGLVAAGMVSWLHRQQEEQQTQPVITQQPSPVKSLVEQHQHDMQARAQEADKELKVSLVAMSATGIANVIYPPLLLFSVPLTVYGSMPIFRDAWQYWREKRRMHSSVIDAVAITGTVATGYYFAAAVINGMYFLGQKVLLKTEDHSSQKLLKLFSDTPRSVWLWRDGAEVETPFEDVQTGQLVVIHAGESIPFDGEIVQGTATVDQHMLTGESRPQEKTVGDSVFASTLLTAGKLHIRVDKAGKDTVAAQISEVLQNTLDFKSTVEARGTRIANQMTLPTLALTGIALGKLGPVGASTVANCNFSDIIRITIPLGVLNHLKLAAEQGILVKDGRALELLGEVDTVVFDKTGTLTHEEPEVGQIHTCNGFSTEQVLSLAATAEHRQTHPVARAILQAASQRGLQIGVSDHTHYELGHGIRAQMQGLSILLGSQRFMQKEDIALPANADWHENEAGHSLVYLAVDGKLAGVIELQPQLRPEVPAIVRKLRKRGLQLCILSGDHEQPTRQLAESLGIQHYFAETLPEDKARHIEELQAQGRKICFIGDGINDAVAMKTAQVAISLAGATTVATDTASIVLLDKSLQQLDNLFTLANGFDRNMKSGLAWSLLPGIAGIGAVFVLHMRIYGAVGLYLLSLGAGAANATHPLLQRKKFSRTQE
ncbi:heavy metal translocating P-type ATPase [Thiothrix nivea]|uniref:P-type Zn(2+) transporter n=1 Tax=Thiothrix nivea (strain ATCC 35100 / DSM 5205 / JP2) TaxID=870187 RepID=A0A656HIN5_THINJ|nr:heavy metal translocating P-type ATPase [Thiothrix nivea]EIJ36851.1 heavy metal translocating P-type ATPase [Thiothrix nivea DSM 5205]